MPYKEREISKMYYTIGEVAILFDVNQSLIRFYEKEFDVLQPKKTKKATAILPLKILKTSKLFLISRGTKDIP